MNICLIPARSGSKRLKNKNIKIFFGKPIINYSIKLALKSKLFDKVIVSTDSIKIAKIAQKSGAEIPFFRPKKYSNDFSTDFDVINHFLNYCNNNKLKLNKLCYLYPTNPLTNIKLLKKCLAELKKKGCQKVITVSKYSQPIQRAIKKNKKGFFEFSNKFYMQKRSQDLENYYFDTANCYWFNFDRIKKFKKELLTKVVMVDKSQICDVNTYEDFKFLKKLYRINNLY